MHRRHQLAVLLLALVLLAAACSDSDGSEVSDVTTAETTPVDTDPPEPEPVDEDPPDEPEPVDDDPPDQPESDDEDPPDEPEPVETVELPASLATVWLDDYELIDEEFGTMVSVSVEGGIRTIVTNALPDHETGEFPNAGNPNEITEQDLTWEFPTEAVVTDTPTEVRTTGVAVNGVKFEPATAETVTCTSGQTYRIEALQDTYDLGLDVNNAHVQPTGEYHYHGVSALLVEAYASEADLVHVGFAADGHLIYVSKSGAYASSYQLTTEARSGTDCVASGRDAADVDIDGTTPDGTYSSDWAFIEGSGDLDECNGTTIDGQYVYLATESYPFVGRCVFGEPAADAGGGGGPGAGGGEGTPPGGAPGEGPPGGGEQDESA